MLLTMSILVQLNLDEQVAYPTALTVEIPLNFVKRNVDFITRSVTKIYYAEPLYF